MDRATRYPRHLAKLVAERLRGGAWEVASRSGADKTPGDSVFRQSEDRRGTTSFLHGGLCRSRGNRFCVPGGGLGGPMELYPVSMSAAVRRSHFGKDRPCRRSGSLFARHVQ